ncbi:hypothetical protein H8E07_17140, partial [bacterium]|nr:hypothetical protein [bacterium]
MGRGGGGGGEGGGEGGDGGAVGRAGRHFEGEQRRRRHARVGYRHREVTVGVAVGQDRTDHLSARADRNTAQERLGGQAAAQSIDAAQPQGVDRHRRRAGLVRMAQVDLEHRLTQGALGQFRQSARTAAQVHPRGGRHDVQGLG